MISDASPMHMARDLVARHSDIGFVRGYIINYFGRAPAREKIEALRTDYLAEVGRAKDRMNPVASDEKRKARENERRARAAKRYRDRKAAA